MCVDADATPPLTPGDRPITTERLVLESQDGNRLLAYAAAGEEPSPSGVVVLPDVRGIFSFYEQLAERFAAAGHDAVTIDYFGRSAGLDERTDDFDFAPHVDATTHEGVKVDVAAGVAHLLSARPDRRIFTVGFCFGGSNSWFQAANGHGLAGAVGFYGHPLRERPPGAGTVVDRATAMECPILALQAGDDQMITADLNEAFESALTTAGIEHEIVIYDGAPHSFFDRSYGEHATASADAWVRVLAFIDANR